MKTNVSAWVAVWSLLAGCHGAPSPAPLQLAIEVWGDGSGSVEGPASFRCTTGRCEATIAGESATVQAVAGPSSTFVGWSGACSGALPSCTIASGGPGVARAEFEPIATAHDCPAGARPPEAISRFFVEVGVERIDWTWAAPRSECPVTDYVFTVNTLENDEIVTTVTHHSITSAGHGIFWCIFVKARSKAGVSRPVPMCGRVPDTPPAPVNVIAFPSADGADVYWNHPETFAPPSPEAITGYRAVPAGMDLFAQSTPVSVTVPAGSEYTLKAHVPGLTAGESYRFVVDSINEVGFSTRFQGGAQPSNPLSLPLSSWHAGPLLPDPRGDDLVVAFASHLYVIGGTIKPFAVPSADVRARIEEDGSLGPWEPIPTVPRRDYAGGALYAPDPSHAFVYFTGGFDPAIGGSQSDDVLVAPIGADGALGEWSLAGKMPANRTTHAIALFKDFLYVVGGVTTDPAFTAVNQASVRDIQVARLLPDGTISTWMTTKALPFGRQSPAAAVYKNHLYVFGGISQEAMPRQSVLQVATLGEDGLIADSWTDTTAQPIGNAFDSMFIDGDRMYVLGSDDWQKGGGGGAPTGSVQVGTIDPLTGDVTSWTNLGSDGYFGLHFATSAALWNSTIYMPGGRGVFGGGLATVQYARLGSDGHVASF
jgi:hypothetical protein